LSYLKDKPEKNQTLGLLAGFQIPNLDLVAGQTYLATGDSQHLLVAGIVPQLGVCLRWRGREIFMAFDRFCRATVACLWMSLCFDYTITLGFFECCR